MFIASNGNTTDNEPIFLNPQHFAGAHVESYCLGFWQQVGDH
jgi:hypothetical protein